MWFMLTNIPQSLCIKYMLRSLISSPVPVDYSYGSCHQTGISMKYGEIHINATPSGRRDDQKPGWKSASRNRSGITNPNSKTQPKKSRDRQFSTQRAVIWKVGKKGLVGDLGDSWKFDSFVDSNHLTQIFPWGFLRQW